MKVPEFVPKQNLRIETDPKVTKQEATFTDADEERAKEIESKLPPIDVRLSLLSLRLISYSKSRTSG